MCRDIEAGCFGQGLSPPACGDRTDVCSQSQGTAHRAALQGSKGAALQSSPCMDEAVIWTVGTLLDRGSHRPPREAQGGALRERESV